MGVSNLENAFLVLLGQIAIICTGVFFGIPYLIVSGSTNIDAVATDTVLLALFLGGSSVLMMVNVVLGWSSLRHCVKDSANYNEKMFVIDVVVTVIFFLMNNVLLITLGFGGTDIDTDRLAQFSNGEVATYSLSFGLASMLVLSAAYFGANKLWNRFYEIQSGVKNNANYERFTSACIAFIIIAFGYLLYDFESNWAQSFGLFVFFGAWIAIDGYYLFSGYFDEPISEQRPSVPETDEEAGRTQCVEERKVVDHTPRTSGDGRSFDVGNS